MPFEKIKIIPFPISLEDLDKDLALNFFRIVSFDHGVGSEELPLYWCWIKSDDEELRICFRDELSPEEDVLFESLWSSLNETEEQGKLNNARVRAQAIENARAAAVTSNWDQLTSEQRKLIIGIALTESEVDQVVAGFGS